MSDTKIDGLIAAREIMIAPHNAWRCSSAAMSDLDDAIAAERKNDSAIATARQEKGGEELPVVGKIRVKETIYFDVDVSDLKPEKAHQFIQDHIETWSLEELELTEVETAHRWEIVRASPPNNPALRAGPLGTFAEGTRPDPFAPAPLESGDLTTTGVLFGARISPDYLPNKMVEVFLEDDDHWHFKMRFNVAWLGDLQTVLDVFARSLAAPAKKGTGE